MSFLEQIKSWFHLGQPIDPYLKHRREVESCFTERSRLPATQEEHLSPSGRYRLEIVQYDCGKGHWNFSRGRIYRVADGVLLAEVKRNYPDFWFAWIEGHPNGSDYLVCGENYQGQTLCNLTQGTQQSHRSRTFFGGLCWRSAHPSPQQDWLAVLACPWGGSDQLLVVDFSQPDQMPWSLQALDEIEDFQGWQDDYTVAYTEEIEVRKSDRVPYRDLSEAEQEPLDQDYHLLDYETVTRKVDVRTVKLHHADAPPEWVVDLLEKEAKKNA